AFVVLKTGADVPAGARCLWALGNGGSSSRFYPNTDGTIQEDFGSTGLRNIGRPAQSLSQPHLYNVASRAGEWTARINGAIQLTTTNNAYSILAGQLLGKTAGTGTYFDGDVAELMIFTRVLSQAERDSVTAYLNARYALV